MVVFGIPEDRDETESLLKQKVRTDIFANKLGVTCTSVARIHRLGKHNPKRPVVLFFQDYNEKQQVLKNCLKLKGTKISVQNDYLQNTLRKRKLLWGSAKEENQQGKIASLINDKLRVDGQLYTWDDGKNSRVPLSSYHKSQSRD